MSNYIQVPNTITSHLPNKKRNKIEAFIYAAIRGEIKDDTRTASYSENRLAKLIGQTERSVNNYIRDLKDGVFFTGVTKKHGEHEYSYNVYELPYLSDDYFIIKPELISKTDLTPEQKGILMFIKANCWAGTNHLSFTGMTTDLADKLQIGKNGIKSKLRELEKVGSIRFIGNTLIIIDDCFPLAINTSANNLVYETIYKFCLYKDRVPPYKIDTNKMGRHHYDESISQIAGKYVDRYSQLQKDLFERCTELPESLSTNYFCKALNNKIPEKKEKKCSKILID